MSITSKQIGALELFNEKASKLFSLNFVKEVTYPKTGVLISGAKNEKGSLDWTVTRKGPSQDSIDAFVLTFRFFIQDNEKSSFKNIASIYEELDNDQFSKNGFNAARKYINDFLDSLCAFNVTHNGKHITNREIMETFVYGGLAHANEKKQIIFKEWMEFPPSAALFEAAFVFILVRVLNAIDYISVINESVIKGLKNITPN